MRGKAPAALRLEHLIGEHVLFSDIPVRRDLLRIDVLVWLLAGRSGTLRTACGEVEAVHLAAVVIADEAGVRVPEIARIGQIFDLQL